MYACSLNVADSKLRAVNLRRSSVELGAYRLEIASIEHAMKLSKSMRHASHSWTIRHALVVLIKQSTGDKAHIYSI